MTRRVRLDIQYVGTSYAGWQLQPGRPTIQGSLETALARLLQQPVRVHGSGRTDAGVHALGQVAHFDTGSALATDRIRGALNHFLPWDIQVRGAAEAPAAFHARESARSKEYRYKIHRGEVMPPDRYPFSWLATEGLDLGAMRRAAAGLIGTHDFASLRCAGSSAETTVRTVFASEWLEEGPELVYRIVADGFLYKMVRTIVGSLVEIGRGKRHESTILELIRTQDRSLAGPVAPPRGLHLWEVLYDCEPVRGDGAGSVEGR